MIRDPRKSVWVSHSSISNFLKCPRLYYLHDVYKDPKTRNKMSLMTPPMALGLAVHDVLDSLGESSAQDRFKIPLAKKFDVVWKKYTGKLGGFKNQEEEENYKERGIKMLKRLDVNPGLLTNKTVKIKTDFIPNYFINDKDEIILCGKVDWLEYLPETDSVHIVDFKTGKNLEGDESLQLPIYLLLVTNTQKRDVTKASYWYLDNDGELLEKQLPNLEDAYDQVYKVASRIALARKLNRMVCPHGGCRDCLPYERLLKGEGELVGKSDSGQDVFILKN